ncbi:MAG: adenosylcobinamide-GDP ribazoletransferase, partial [Arachnia sp.]
RVDGFGALFFGVTSRVTAWVCSGVVVVLTTLAGWAVQGGMGAWLFGIASLLALTVGWLWRAHLKRRLGGMTGDIFGSLIEVTQATFLVSLVVLRGLVERL